MAENAVAVKEEEKLPNLSVASGINLEEDAGDGFENVTSQDIKIPMLTILQANSPQCKKSDQQRYIKGAEEGDIYDNVTQTVIKSEEGFNAIICYYQSVYLEWIPRNEDGSGGGLAGIHAKDSPVVLNARKDKNARDGITEAGNELNRTIQLYCIVIMPDGSRRRAVVPMSRTQLKKAKDLMTKLDSIKLKSGKNAPMYASVHTFTTAPEVKDTWSWFNWKTTLNRLLNVGAALTGKAEVSEEDITLYTEAKAFYELIKQGDASVQVSQEGISNVGATQTEVDDTTVDGDIPF